MIRSIHNFECAVEKKFNVTHLEHELKDLRILASQFAKEKNGTVEKTMLLSVQPEGNLFNNFTMKHEEKPMLLAIFNKEEITDEGFRVKDVECWREFRDMMEHDGQVKLKLMLSF